MGLVFGLASSLVWGTADFLGGVYTRRLTLAAVNQRRCASCRLRRWQ